MLLKNLEHLEDYVSGTKGDETFIRLSSNENNYGPSPKVVETIKKISSLTYKYPNSSYNELKETLANLNGVTKNNIILGNGSDEIFFYLFIMYLDENSSILTIEKTFTYYRILANILGAKVIEAKREENFSISCENIINSLNSSVKIVIFPSPDNPTGVITKRECIEKILISIPKETIFILDEAYFHFVPQELYWNSVDLLKKYDNFIITRTFSKFYALAGIRLGYGICSEKISKLYEKIRMPFNISLVSTEAGKAAISDNEYYSTILKRILEDKKILIKELKNLGIEVLEESYGNFVFIKAPEELGNKLFEKKIIIRDLKSFNYEPGYFRITIGKTEENKALIKAIKEVL
jgi:histidinol-phosphate aminotransferase